MECFLPFCFFPTGQLPSEVFPSSNLKWFFLSSALHLSFEISVYHFLVLDSFSCSIFFFSLFHFLISSHPYVVQFPVNGWLKVNFLRCCMSETVLILPWHLSDVLDSCRITSGNHFFEGINQKSLVPASFLFLLPFSFFLFAMCFRVLFLYPWSLENAQLSIWVFFPPFIVLGTFLFYWVLSVSLFISLALGNSLIFFPCNFLYTLLLLEPLLTGYRTLSIISLGLLLFGSK